MLGVVPPAAAQISLPSGFDTALVVQVASPTALAFTPDGRMLVTTQPGRLRIVRNGTLLAAAALDLGAVLCTDSERGLLGVAVDPAFASNRTIYLFYTFKKSGVCERNTSRAPVNRVSRFVLSDAHVVDTPTTRIGTPSAVTYVLEDCSACGLSGWGWQDNGYGANVLGPEIFFGATGRQTLRIQTREDGLSIDQVVLSPSRYRTSAPGRTKDDTTIVPR